MRDMWAVGKDRTCIQRILVSGQLEAAFATGHVFQREVRE